MVSLKSPVKVEKLLKPEALTVKATFMIQEKFL
jgi:hypothetical protein